MSEISGLELASLIVVAGALGLAALAFWIAARDDRRHRSATSNR